MSEQSMTSGGFNWNDLPDSDLIPDGIYPVKIVKVSEVKLTQKPPHDEFISLQFKLNTPEDIITHEKIVCDNFVKIKSGAMKRLLIAIQFDKEVFDDVQVLLDEDLQINIGSQYRGTNKEQNNVVGYIKLEQL